jgi:hypothetical protein
MSPQSREQRHQWRSLALVPDASVRNVQARCFIPPLCPWLHAHSAMAPKRKRHEKDLETTDEPVTYCILCSKDHVASITSRHKQGLARPGTIASAMLEDRFVEVPETKQTRRGRQVSKAAKVSLTSKLQVDIVDEPFAYADASADVPEMNISFEQPPATVDIEDVLRSHAGPRAWFEDVEDEDDILRQTHERGGQEQDDGEDVWDPAEDDEADLEAWMIEMEQAAKREIQDFGKQYCSTTSWIC